MSLAGFEIDDEPVVRFVVEAVAARASGACLVRGVNMPVHLMFEVKR